MTQDVRKKHSQHPSELNINNLQLNNSVIRKEFNNNSDLFRISSDINCDNQKQLYFSHLQKKNNYISEVQQKTKFRENKDSNLISKLSFNFSFMNQNSTNNNQFNSSQYNFVNQKTASIMKPSIHTQIDTNIQNQIHPFTNQNNNQIGNQLGFGRETNFPNLNKVNESFITNLEKTNLGEKDFNDQFIDNSSNDEEDNQKEINDFNETEFFDETDEDDIDESNESNDSYISNDSNQVKIQNSTEIKKRNKRRKKRKLQRVDFEKVMHLTQRDAAKELDICLSSFKRQLRSLRPKLKWPRKSGYKRKVIISRHDVELQSRLETLVKETELIEYQQLKTQERDTSNFSNNFTIHIPSQFSINNIYIPSNQFVNNLAQQDNQMYNKYTELWDQRNNSDIPNISSISSGEIQSYQNNLSSSTISLPNIYYRGDINSLPGPWSSIYHEHNDIALALADKESNIVASNSLFQNFTGYTCQDFIKGFNLCQLHLPTAHRLAYREQIEKLHDIKHISTVEFTTVLEHKTGVLLVFHVILHFLPLLGLHWGEFRFSNKFMSNVVFRNSITRKEKKENTIKKPVSECTVNDMIYDDIQTKNALIRGTEKIEKYPEHYST